MRNIFIERREKLLRVAIKDNNILKACYIEEESNEPIPGEIYKGIVKKLVPAIKSAFLDIGFNKQAYMLCEDKSIKCGDELIVEVVKESIGSKGAKVTPKFSIAGRFVVLETSHNDINVSKKINNEQLRRDLKESLLKSKDIGITVRTKAENVHISIIQQEIKDLNEVYCNVIRNAKYSLHPKKIYGDIGLISKVIRENITSDTNEILVDSKEDYEILKESLEECERKKIELYEEKRTLFDYYGIEKEILSLRNNKVNLKCGGYIVIDKTEAMYVIDVNSGKHTTAKNMEKTAEETNLEAAKEIARQIKVRNLSGIILIDFIDMHKGENKRKVLDLLKEELNNDKQKSKIFPFTELNLVQISRARKGKSIYEYIEESCDMCHGYGKRLKLSYIYLLVKNEILKKDVEGKINDFHIEINSIYEKHIREDIFNFLKNIGALNLNIYLEFKDFNEFYKVEPLIFKKQIDNVKEYLVKNIEKY
ncbi:Rne/Rng family ribonuclease [Clostridium tarantellae]|uniref:Rne/Rng family ribonuclease n=1 Tax=Clostridium tarantellae TaxID=39493 RepID=A0A6I1MHX7_9CLOT|nr:Rne/Rng family ribonuclease [Clostridium tarantellae]MPQ42484.1 Rne/Rng family ribonuclease [Clostridium tarantellae]